MKTRIIVDSTADMPKRIKERVETVPMTILFGDKAYLDGVTISHREFYEKLVSAETPPTTSQATPADFDRIFRQVRQQGEEAVVLTVASQLSGTCQSACIAAAEYEGIYVVDTESVTIGTGILASFALRLAEEGKSAAQIAKTLEEAKHRVCLFAVLDTLEYLKRGGRISKTAAVAGSLLSIKPVISLAGGQIQVVGKARGNRQGNRQLAALVEEAGIDRELPVLLGYTGVEDDLLQAFREESAALWQDHPAEAAQVGSVVGTHAGPGAVAAAFFRKA